MIEFLLPTALYAETHFRFWGCSPSALFRKAPEIVFDMPRRLAPGRDLPVALLLNDIGLYPVRIESVQITVSRPHTDTKPKLIEFDPQRVSDSEVDHPLKGLMGAYLLMIPRTELDGGGEVFVNACLRYRRVNKKGVPDKSVCTVLNDNLVTSTKYSYRCTISDEEYPGAGLCSFGDVHCHSQFSRSHVEFGPPIDMIGAVAAASGLGFAAVTDHSYDLACAPENFLCQDKYLRMWQLYKSAVDNYRGETLIIPGEEVSALNSTGRVVHLCGLGVNEYIPGTLDGARKSAHVNRQLTIGEVADEIARQGGVAFAAHPGAKAGLMQRIFLRRGIWSDADIGEAIGGIQAVNSGFSDSWRRGKVLWINALQRGLKAPLLAGSDAHGDFNRYRAIGAPFVQIHEDAERYMGFVRTGIYGKRTDAAGIIDGIREGATFITSGPFVTICDSRRTEVPLVNSSNPVIDKTNLCVRAVSAKEFGPLKVIGVIMGRQGVPEEKIIAREELPDNTLDATIPIPADALPEICYLRAEVYGKSPRDLPSAAATSACFVGY